MLKNGCYNVLIVDDEPLFRLALRTLLTESGLPFHIIGEASDGEEALKYKQTVPNPDLIIVDMKMPKISGIEFMRKWKEHDTARESNPVMIALSAYQDYEFVREAFLLGALDYIVKVDMDRRHVIPVLNKAIVELEKRELRPAVGTSGISSGKDAVLRKLLESEAGDDAVQHELLTEWGVALPGKERVVAVILPDLRQPQSGHDATGEMIKSVLEQVMQSKGMRAEIIRNREDEYVLFMHQAENRSFMYLWNRLNELFTVVQRRLTRYANMTVTVGVSNPGTKPWKELYGEALRAADLRFFCGCGKLLFPDSRKTWEYANSRSMAGESRYVEYGEAVLQALTNPDPGVWLKSFHAWSTCGIPAAGEHQVRKLFSDFVWKLGAFMLTKQCQWEQLPDPYRQPFQFIDEGITLEQLWAQLKLLIEAIHIKIYESPATPKGVLQLAKTYIDHHYGDGITLTLVSNWVGVSESHLSKLFAKEAGEKFIDYLTRIRIRQAKELMGTGMKLYEISESVGYPNPEHFSRVFKKETGLSPAQYRDQLQKQK